MSFFSLYFLARSNDFAAHGRETRGTIHATSNYAISKSILWFFLSGSALFLVPLFAILLGAFGCSIYTETSIRDIVHNVTGDHPALMPSLYVYWSIFCFFMCKYLCTILHRRS